MVLNNETKNKIAAEYESFKKDMYGSKRLRKETPEADRKPGEIFREDLDAFYTPAELTIQMIEKFDCGSLEDKKILDPCCGSGNLLAACIIAGANPKNIYGNEFDPDMVEACKRRLNSLCRELNLELVPEENIHEGNALHDFCLTIFDPCYEACYFCDKRKNHSTIKNDDTSNEKAWNQYRKYYPQEWAIRDEMKRQQALEAAPIICNQSDEETLW